MGYEVEVKFRVTDHVDLERRLAEIGAEAEPMIHEEDTYLAHPSRDFSLTGEAFRIRTEGELNKITYKGPKQDGPTKTREEIEIDFTEGAAAAADLGRLLNRLGFQPVATVRKKRRGFSVRRAGRTIQVVLDVAEGLGTYVEVETLAEANQLKEAQLAVMTLADELGLVDVEPRSYLRMRLEALGRL